jgi:hypothetical protein
VFTFLRIVCFNLYLIYYRPVSSITMHISPRRPRKEAQVPLSIRDEPNVFPDTLDGLEDHQRDGGSMTPPLAHPASTLAPSTRIVEPEYRPSKTARHQDPGRPQSTRSKQTSTKPTRPGLQRRRTTARTRYIDMLLGLDHVSPFHNFLASLCVWILLAGYIVFPATFTKLQNEEIEDKTNNRIKAAALQTVRNVPLLYVASFACAIGVVGCLWLWWKHRKNYVWVINRIFLPALLNSIAGLISTIVNVYTAQDGESRRRELLRFVLICRRSVFGHSNNNHYRFVRVLGRCRRLVPAL